MRKSKLMKWVVVLCILFVDFFAGTSARKEAKAAPSSQGNYTISTVAGTGDIGNEEEALKLRLSGPQGVEIDAAGNVYFAEFTTFRVRKVDSSGWVTTVAGSGEGYFLPEGHNGPAVAARLSNPRGLFLQGTKLYIAETDGDRISAVDLSTGVYTVIAGNGEAGYRDGRVEQALFNNPQDIVLDAAGNIYVADYGNHRVRKIDTNGDVTTVAGNGLTPAQGNPEWLPNGINATDAKLYHPYNVALDNNGNLYVNNHAANTIVKVDTAGKIWTIAGNGNYGAPANGADATNTHLGSIQDIVIHPVTQEIYLMDSSNKRIYRLDSMGKIGVVAGTGSGVDNGDGSTLTTNLQYPNFGKFDASGNLIFSDQNKLRKMTADGNVVTLAGEGRGDYYGRGPGTAARLHSPTDVAVTNDNTLFISDSLNHRILQVSQGNAETYGLLNVFAGTGISGYKNNFYLKTSNFQEPSGLAVRVDEAYYSLLIADTQNHRIRSTQYSWLDNMGAGNGTAGYAGDGNYSNDASVMLNSPTGIAYTNNKDYYIADTNNHRVRKVTYEPSWTISSVAGTGTADYTGDGGAATNAKLSSPRGVAVDSQGNVYIADTGNHAVRKIDKATGAITTVAGKGTAGYSGDGGKATTAELNEPWDVALDKHDNLYIADTGNHAVRRVDQFGKIITVAGSGTAGYGGDGGSALTAKLNGPTGITVGQDGAIYIADRGNHRVRKVVQQTIAKADANGTAVRVSTFGVPDAKSVTAWLVDELGNTVPGVEGSDTIASQAANIPLLIPSSLPAGLYRIVVQVDGVAETKEILWTTLDEARLQDLTVNGVTVAGFGSTVEEYDVVLPYGTTMVPSVNGTVYATGKANAVVTAASSLPGTTTIVVTAEDGTTKKTYRINFTVALNSAKGIVSFDLQGLSPVVTGAINESAKTIALSVPYGTDVTQLVPAISHSGVNLSPANGQSVDFTDPVVYKVTAEDGSTVTYLVTVTVGQSDNANLASLSLSNASLSPTFEEDKSEYFASVTSAVYETNVIAVPADPHASVVLKSGGQIIANPMPLNIGLNLIEAVVTAESGATKSYLVYITRLPNTDKAIINFAFQGLNPAVAGIIDETSKSITLSVPYGTDVTQLVPTLSFVGTSVTPGSGQPGDFTHPVLYTVTAEDGSTVSYLVTVTIGLSANANLASLGLSNASLSPEFAAQATQYTASVSNDIRETNVIALPSDPKSSVVMKRDGQAIVNPVQLNVGVNVIQVVVSAENGTVKSYFIEVTRLAAVPSGGSSGGGGSSTEEITVDVE
uniref:NHL domain-containing protein n=1 Tax=Cohnella mopanensis TaxID=2911966 RepID=UPI001EF92F40